MGQAEKPSPEDVHVLILRTCDYLILRSKRDSARVFRLNTLRWARNSGLSRWAQCHHKGFSKRQMGRHWTIVISLAVKMKDGVRSQGIELFLDAAHGTETNSALEPPRGTGRVDILRPARCHPLWTSDHQDCLMINFCCLKP